MIHNTPTRRFAMLTLMIVSCGCATSHRFDPLEHDNEWDHNIDLDNLTIMAFGTSLWYTITPPTNKEERLAFFLDNIDRTSTESSSPNGECVTPITLHILKMGEQVLPMTRAIFRMCLTEPEYYEKAKYMSYVLGRFRDTTVFDDLALAALNHPNDWVRNTCTWALPRTGGGKEIPVLAELLYEHPTLHDEWINQTAAAEAMSVSTGKSFPEQMYWEPEHKPRGFEEDLGKWRTWSKTAAAGLESQLAPAVAEAVAQRRKLRLMKTGEPGNVSP